MPLPGFHLGRLCFFTSSLEQVSPLCRCFQVAEEGVAISPGRGFGPGGFGRARIALVGPAP